MRLSDYVADFVAGLTDHLYGICGGGAMYLNDALAHHPNLKWVATHHEQAAAFAAEAAARVTNKIGVVHVTAGPGVTNALTGVACAFADSLPMLVIAGQVDSSTMMDAGVRQLGISEVDGVALMTPVTKYAVSISQPSMIRFHLEKAAHLAMHRRKGPVYVEIPLDVQRAEINPAELLSFHPITSQPPLLRPDDLDKCMALLQQSRRPVLLIGNGVRLSGAQQQLRDLTTVGPTIPVLCSWSGADLIASDHPLYVGRPGLIGDRAGNFAVQNADLVIAVGTRLSLPQIGHNWDKFAPNAKLVVVDVSEPEINKKTLRVDLGIVADAGGFLAALVGKASALPEQAWAPWIARCRQWRDSYPAIDPSYREASDGVHSYYFLQALADHIDDDAIIVTDVGTAFVGTMQALPMSGRQRMFHSPGIAPMGYGLPAAIGACVAGQGRQVVCLNGDGGIMFNLQELQTIVNYQLPILIVVYANRGYKTMQVTQENHFGREALSSPQDLSWPDFTRVADGFGIPWKRCSSNSEMVAALKQMLHTGLTRISGPRLLQLDLSKSQTISPLVKTKVADGAFVPVPLEDMWPYLPREEFAANMINS